MMHDHDRSSGKFSGSNHRSSADALKATLLNTYLWLETYFVELKIFFCGFENIYWWICEMD